MGRKNETTSLGEVVAHERLESRERALAEAYYEMERQMLVHDDEYDHSRPASQREFVIGSRL